LGRRDTFPDVQINQQSAELVALLCVGVDFGGKAGGGAVLRSISAGARMLFATLGKKNGKTYALLHLLHNPPNNRITKPLITQLQPKKIRQRQPHPLAVLVRFVVPIIGVVLIAVGVVRAEFAGVEEIAVDFESLVRGVGDGVEGDREVWVGL
jgi:uncharacterized membrane protein YczE